MTETTILSESAVSEIEAKANAASKGPWSMTWNTKFGPAIWSHGDILVRCEAGLKHSMISESDPVPQWQKDMDFMRAARADIPALCATVKHLRAEIAEFEQTDLVPRSRYDAANADWLEAREQTKQLAQRAGKEIESLQSQLEQLRAENERLLRGDFTDQELQGFCHNLSEQDQRAFFEGCTKYQQRLFGTSVAEQVREEIK